MAKLGEEQVMVADGMVRKGASIRQIARQLGVTEGALRYRLRKRADGPLIDGRSRRPTGVAGFEGAIQAMLERLGGWPAYGRRAAGAGAAGLRDPIPPRHHDV
jgi:AcrR family transcriptional regulator